MPLIPRLGIHSVQGDGFRWATVLPAMGGQACPDCGAVVIGANHRAQHQAHHSQVDTLEEAVHTLARAVRTLATEAGHGDWYRQQGSGGIVIGGTDTDTRLTTKARMAMQGDEYNDEEDLCCSVSR
jgi:hypothetical protein